MSFETAMTLDFLEGVPGNAAAYTRLRNDIESLAEWTSNDWTNARFVYFMRVENPGSAWLHDILKNKCQYNTEMAHAFLLDLLRYK